MLVPVLTSHLVTGTLQTFLPWRYNAPARVPGGLSRQQFHPVRKQSSTGTRERGDTDRELPKRRGFLCSLPAANTSPVKATGSSWRAGGTRKPTSVSTPFTTKVLSHGLRSKITSTDSHTRRPSSFLRKSRPVRSGDSDQKLLVGASGPHPGQRARAGKDRGSDGRKPSLVTGLCLSGTPMVCPTGGRQTRSRHMGTAPPDSHTRPGAPLVTGSRWFYHNFVGIN